MKQIKKESDLITSDDFPTEVFGLLNSKNGIVKNIDYCLSPHLHMLKRELEYECENQKFDFYDPYPLLSRIKMNIVITDEFKMQVKKYIEQQDALSAVNISPC